MVTDGQIVQEQRGNLPNTCPSHIHKDSDIIYIFARKHIKLYMTLSQADLDKEGQGSAEVSSAQNFCQRLFCTEKIIKGMESDMNVRNFFPR